jgi:hypothetical protein
MVSRIRYQKVQGRKSLIKIIDVPSEYEICHIVIKNRYGMSSHMAAIRSKGIFFECSCTLLFTKLVALKRHAEKENDFSHKFVTKVENPKDKRLRLNNIRHYKKLKKSLKLKLK